MGVWFSQNITEVIDLNFTERIKKMQQLINIWTSRSLSLKGKITIIRSVILPQIQFLFSMVYVPKEILDKVDKILFQFLWNNKPPKIRRNTIIAPISEGGLGMVDTYEVHAAAKCGWIKRLISKDNGKWKTVMWKMLNITRNLLNKNLELKTLQAKTCFHQQILDTWYRIHNTYPDSGVEIINQDLLFNQFIKINNKHITSRQMPIENLKIIDIINLDGKFKSYEEIYIQTNGQLDQMSWNSLICAIPKEWKGKLRSITNIVQLTQLIKENTTYISYNKKPRDLIKISTKEIYQLLVSKKQMPPKAIDKWVDIFPFMENFEWKSVYELPSRIIKEPYLQSFQYKLLNRVINCKDKLFVWKISENNQCIYCTKVDTIEHHFFRVCRM